MSTPALPVETIDPGTTLVVGSSDLDRAQTLGTLLLSMGCNPDDGVLFVATDTPGDDLLTQCEEFELDPEETDLQLIDGTGDAGGDPDADVDVEPLPDDDLTSMGIKFSVVHENLSERGARRVLAGVQTLSSILEAHDLRKIVRFLNTVSSRIENGGGLMVFVIDATAHERETLETISQVCDGYIEVRGADDDENEIRIHGLPDQPEGWLAVPAPLLPRRASGDGD